MGVEVLYRHKYSSRQILTDRLNGKVKSLYLTVPADDNVFSLSVFVNVLVAKQSWWYRVDWTSLKCIVQKEDTRVDKQRVNCTKKAWRLLVVILTWLYILMCEWRGRWENEKFFVLSFVRKLQYLDETVWGKLLRLCLNHSLKSTISHQSNCSSLLPLFCTIVCGYKGA